MASSSCGVQTTTFPSLLQHRELSGPGTVISYTYHTS